MNARHVNNVPGRRTDVSDCQWLQFLHSVGLRRASYRPDQEVCAIRSLLRHRESLVQMAATHLNHMQKALDQMNLQLHHVISDITGLTGFAIVDAILAGERNPATLARLRHERKASEEVIAISLVGDYRPEHLFTLRQSVVAYRSYQKLIDDCDAEIRRCLDEFKPPPGGPASSGEGDTTRKSRSNDGVLRTELKRVFGVDLTRIPGIRTGIAQTLFGEIGPDFTKFRSASAFASWMGLCPDNDISGGKVLWTGTRKVNCRAATALRMAAQSLHHSKSGLGDFYRRMRAKLGAPKAITAAAHKLARIIFHLVTTRQEFDDSRFAADQSQYQKRLEAKLRAKPKPKRSASSSSLYSRRRWFLKSVSDRGGAVTGLVTSGCSGNRGDPDGEHLMLSASGQDLQISRRGRLAMSKNPKTVTDPMAGLPPLNLNAAGIDVGDEEHWVAIPPGRETAMVRRFGTFTADLRVLAEWLRSCGIDTVVMESTGVYWVALYDALEESGLDVHLVNARQVKQLPGRKTDIEECQWLQTLHTFGLLTAASGLPKRFAYCAATCGRGSGWYRQQEAVCNICNKHLRR